MTDSLPPEWDKIKQRKMGLTREQLLKMRNPKPPQKVDPLAGTPDSLVEGESK